MNCKAQSGFSKMGNTTSTQPTTAPARAPMDLPISRIPARLGQRVVRGPDWKWDNQDGGDGHVGTLVVVEHCPSDDDAATFCVRVLWDGGLLSNCRASRNGACDLRLYDSGPVGIRFPTVTCDVCSKSGISGTRWKCSVCFDYDLCHSCYMSDKHLLDHAFIRIDAPGAQGVKVPPRQGSTKVEVRGIFEGAKVARGGHWKWADQDGGQGSVGTVLSIRDWDDSCVHSEARVQWSGSSVNSYRLGFGGDVDLKCTVPALGGSFYKDHMPLIAPVDVSRSEVGKSGFRVGDPVCVTLDADCFEMLQQGHGGWVPSLAENMNKVGTIQKEASTGDVFVSFGSSTRWVINPVALTKVPVFSPGDTVKIIDDLQKMKTLQVKHGGFADTMSQCLGKTGVVIKVHPTCDVRVLVDRGTAWTLNPLCLTSLGSSSAEDITARLSMLAGSRGMGDDLAGQFLRMLRTTIEEAGATRRTASRYTPGQKLKISSNIHQVKLLQVNHGGYCSSMDACLGKVGTLVSVDSDGDLKIRFRGGAEWCFNPRCAEPVDSSEGDSDSDSSGDDASTGLQRLIHELLGDESNRDRIGTGTKKVKASTMQAACYCGSEEIVKLLASNGADLEEEDADGDKPIHYAAYGNEPGIITLLTNLGANINSRNKRNHTALHVAVNKEFVNCVRVLTSSASRLDVNLQDEDGDTPIHDAVGKKSLEAIDMLLNFPGADFTIKNKRGFNVLHMAALKGNNFAVERILSKKPDLVNVKKTDGYGPLHIAALNGHHLVVKTLLNQRNCTVDLENTEQQTPLLLAVYKGFCDIAELLVQAGADINKPDNDGDTAMHMSLLRRSEVQPQSLSASNSPAVTAVMQSLLESGQRGADTRLALACFLANRGGDLHRTNKKGLSTLKIAESAAEVELLLIWKTKTCEATPVSSTVPDDEQPVIRGVACKICDECPANVRFDPCGHKLYCEECCKRMKCCLSCGVKITAKVAIEEKVLSYAKADSGAQKELESKLREMEEAHSCGICMERPRNIIFMCGHGACDTCARALQDCHICRRTITNRITLY